MKKVIYTITGSTGTKGSELVRLLSKAGFSVRAMMRNYERIQEDLPFEPIVTSRTTLIVYTK